VGPKMMRRHSVKRVCGLTQCTCRVGLTIVPGIIAFWLIAFWLDLPVMNASTLGLVVRWFVAAFMRYFYS